MDTTVSIDEDFWKFLNQIVRGTGESKRGVLWEMARRYLENEDVRAYLQLRGVNIEDLSNLVELNLKEGSLLVSS